MLAGMTDHLHHRVGDVAARRAGGQVVRLGDTARRTFSISCDDCSQQCTAACDDCVVTHVLRHADEAEPSTEVNGLILDVDQARVVRLMTKAGLVPDLKFEIAG
jgi:hypothetical protein